MKKNILITSILVGLMLPSAFAFADAPLPEISLPSGVAPPIVCQSGSYNPASCWTALETRFNTDLANINNYFTASANLGLSQYLNNNYFNQAAVTKLFSGSKGSQLVNKGASENEDAALIQALNLRPTKGGDFISDYLNQQNPFVKAAGDLSQAGDNLAGAVLNYYDTNYTKVNFVQLYLNNNYIFNKKSTLTNRLSAGLNSYFAKTLSTDDNSDFIYTYFANQAIKQDTAAINDLMSSVNSGFTPTTAGKTLQSTIQNNMVANLGGNAKDGVKAFIPMLITDHVKGYFTNEKNNPFNQAGDKNATNNLAKGLNDYLQNATQATGETDFINTYLQNNNPFQAKDDQASTATTNINDALGTQVNGTGGRTLVSSVNTVSQDFQETSQYCAIIVPTTIKPTTPQVAAAFKGPCAHGGVMKFMPGTFSLFWRDKGFDSMVPSNLVVEGSGKNVTILQMGWHVQGMAGTSFNLGVNDTFADMTIETDGDYLDGLFVTSRFQTKPTYERFMHLKLIDMGQFPIIYYPDADPPKGTIIDPSFYFNDVTAIGSSVATTALFGADVVYGQKPNDGRIIVKNSFIQMPYFYQIDPSGKSPNMNPISDQPTIKGQSSSYPTTTPLPFGSEIINSVIPSDGSLLEVDNNASWDNTPVKLAYRLANAHYTVANSCFEKLAVKQSGLRYSVNYDNDRPYPFLHLYTISQTEQNQHFAMDFDRLCPSNTSHDQVNQSMGLTLPLQPVQQNNMREKKS